MREPPNSKRTQKTYEALLTAAQNIIISDGYDALNSNLIVDRAGMTPPTFYRYFEDKFEVLEVLCHRLMEAQNSLILSVDTADAGEMELEPLVQFLILNTVAVTRDFPAGAQLIKILRIVPKLEPILLSSHNEMATFISKHIVPSTLNIRPGVEEKEIFLRARLALQFGYATLEHLLSEPLANQEILIERTANAMAGIFMDIGEVKG